MRRKWENGKRWGIFWRIGFLEKKGRNLAGEGILGGELGKVRIFRERGWRGEDFVV